MDWFTGIIVFILIWWTAIFTILPFGLKRDEKGIPNDPRIKFKLLVITGVSALVWITVYFLIEADIISFREMARGLSE